MLEDTEGNKYNKEEINFPFEMNNVVYFEKWDISYLHNKRKFFKDIENYRKFIIENLKEKGWRQKLINVDKDIIFISKSPGVNYDEIIIYKKFGDSYLWLYFSLVSSNILIIELVNDIAEGSFNIYQNWRNFNNGESHIWNNFYIVSKWITEFYNLEYNVRRKENGRP
jgi:hypothetical protein